jgi:hypothetical protein
MKSVVVRKYGCVVEILSTELVGVLYVMSPVCEVINSEGHTTSVVSSEVIVSSLHCRKSHVLVGCDVGFFMVPGSVGGLPWFRLWV